MNLDTHTENQPHILATVPYRTTSKPDEKEIRKTIRNYANLNWQLVERIESVNGAEYGQFSLLQFTYAM